MKTPPFSLVMYSGGQSRGNQLLHRELVRLARQKTDEPLRFAYLPYCADGSVTFFMRSVRRYSRFGVGEFCCLAADEKPSRDQIKQALNAHIVYLAGGNTFYFLHALRKSGMIPLLQEYAQGGGILAGLSAGAHILTPHIGLAGAAGLDPDRNEVGLKNLKALDLVPFEILPHFEFKHRTLQAVRKYAGQSAYPVFACPDGTGIVVERGSIRQIGRGVRTFVRNLEI